jgi:hypothetical protein
MRGADLQRRGMFRKNRFSCAPPVGTNGCSDGFWTQENDRPGTRCRAWVSGVPLAHGSCYRAGAQAHQEARVRTQAAQPSEARLMGEHGRRTRAQGQPEFNIRNEGARRIFRRVIREKAGRPASKH